MQQAWHRTRKGGNPPTGIVALVIVTVPLAVLGLIQLIGRPPPVKAVSHTTPKVETFLPRPAAPARLPCLRASLRLWPCPLPVWVGAEGRELPQPRPFEGRLGSGNAGPVSGHDDPERLWLDGAADWGGQHDCLAVDADGDLRGVGADDDLIGGEGGQPRPVPAADEPGCPQPSDP